MIKALPDYTLVHTTGHNVLCVGGAVSTDRNLRISHSYINISWSMVALQLLGFLGHFHHSGEQEHEHTRLRLLDIMELCGVDERVR